MKFKGDPQYGYFRGLTSELVVGANSEILTFDAILSQDCGGLKVVLDGDDEDFSTSNTVEMIVGDAPYILALPYPFKVVD